MARTIQQGMLYFNLDVDFLQNIKVRRILRSCGPQAIIVLIWLLSSIYRDDGYYVQWHEDMPFLIADDVGINEGAVEEIVKKAIQVEFFSAEMYEAYNILTSRGLQQRFFEMACRRKAVNYDERYLLIDINEYSNAINVNRGSVIKVDNNTINANGNSAINVDIMLQNVDKNPINVDIMKHNVDKNQQSKVKESKVKESKGKSIECVRTPTPKSTMRDLIDQTDFSEELKKTVKEWASYKTEKRQAYKETGFRKLLTEIGNKATQYGDKTVIDIINLSMSNNWQGIIWDRITEKATVNNKYENLREWMNE